MLGIRRWNYHKFAVATVQPPNANQPSNKLKQLDLTFHPFAVVSETTFGHDLIYKAGDPDRYIFASLDGVENKFGPEIVVRQTI